MGTNDEVLDAFGDRWPYGQALADIKALRQRVKELEGKYHDEYRAANIARSDMLMYKNRVVELERMYERTAAELSALKAGQGEPVAWLEIGEDEIGRPEPVAAHVNEPNIADHRKIPLYTSAPTIPEGWQLVPIKPTPEMETAGRVKAAMWQGRDIHTAVWYDMLSAAPKPSKPV